MSEKIFRGEIVADKKKMIEKATKGKENFLNDLESLRKKIEIHVDSVEKNSKMKRSEILDMDMGSFLEEIDRVGFLQKIKLKKENFVPLLGKYQKDGVVDEKQKVGDVLDNLEKTISETSDDVRYLKGEGPIILKDKKKSGDEIFEYKCLVELSPEAQEARKELEELREKEQELFKDLINAMNSGGITSDARRKDWAHRLGYICYRDKELWHKEKMIEDMIPSYHKFYTKDGKEVTPDFWFKQILAVYKEMSDKIRKYPEGQEKPEWAAMYY